MLSWQQVVVGECGRHMPFWGEPSRKMYIYIHMICIYIYMDIKGKVRGCVRCFGQQLLRNEPWPACLSVPQFRPACFNMCRVLVEICIQGVPCDCIGVATVSKRFAKGMAPAHGKGSKILPDAATLDQLGNQAHMLQLERLFSRVPIT